MSLKTPSFTVGIEEEYLLVHRDTGDLVEAAPEDLMTLMERELSGRFSPEFLRCQVEVGTGVHRSVSDAGRELAELRATIAELSEPFGLAPIAASTHPIASWHRQRHTDKERYNQLARDLKGVAWRMLICGMHVHLGLDDDELRIDLLGQIAYFLPHLLALSTSSPFWDGVDTGLKSYRLTVFDNLPRTGLPISFDSYSEYRRHVDVLVAVGSIEDATKLWWDCRPSERFPTLEMRISDICTLVDDTIAIAALYVSIAHMLYRLRRQNQSWRRYTQLLIAENRWRAQRYGFDEGLIDFGRRALVPFSELLDELIELTAPDAEALGCVPLVAATRDILTRGSSAHRQVETYRSRLAVGGSEEDALRAVVQQLVEETARPPTLLEPPGPATSTAGGA